MSGNIYWRGRQKALKDKRTQNPPPPPPKKTQGRSLNQKIRDAKRLLAKTNLPEDMRKEKEVLLEGLMRMKKQKELVERERKFAKIYHGVKFIERQKLTRKIKQIKRELEKIEQAKSKGESGEGNENELRQELEKLQGDLKYILNFPNSERYISIVKDITDQAVLEKRAAIRKQILEQPNLRTGESDSEEEGEKGEGEDEEEPENRAGKRKEKFVWNGSSSQRKGSKVMQKKRWEDDEADDEDDKEEIEKKEASKPPKKKARIEPEGPTFTDPQEYGDDLPTLEQDDFFLVGGAQPEKGSNSDDDSGSITKKKPGNVRKRERNENKSPNEDPNNHRKKMKKPNTLANNKRQQKKTFSDNNHKSPNKQHNKRDPQKRVEDNNTHSPKPKHQPNNGKVNQLPKGKKRQFKQNAEAPSEVKSGGEKGRKRKLESREAQNDDDKVEELPSRRKRRSGEAFDIPLKKGQKEAESPAQTPKQKLHIRFDD